MKIAVLLTCHNRREKTVSCLQSLKHVLEIYNEAKDNIIKVEIFLTDDGCTDGTAEAARAIYPDENVLHILKGDGNLFWAGGMRFCWGEALKRRDEWDQYLLLNDDTDLMTNVFDELFGAQLYAHEHFGKDCIVSGITCSKEDETRLTYGGFVRVNKFLGKTKRVKPCGIPQCCDFTNANIFLVPKVIVDDIGIFYEGYAHGHADGDYSIMARKAGYAVVLTANFCGRCDNDHTDPIVEARKVMNMTLRERKKYYSNPVRSNHDYLLAIRRTTPIRLPLVWLGRMLNLYCPSFYYRISGIRKS